MTLDPASQGYDADHTRLTLDRLLDRSQASPGIRQAAVATQLPLYIGFPVLTEVSETVEPCATGGCPRVDTYGIGAGFFDTMRVPMRKAPSSRRSRRLTESSSTSRSPIGGSQPAIRSGRRSCSALRASGM